VISNNQQRSKFFKLPEVIQIWIALIKECESMNQTIVIDEWKPGESIPYELLLLADPSRSNIDGYLEQATLVQARQDERIVGCYVLAVIDQNTMEIKNVAVEEARQGQGIGTRLLEDAVIRAKKKNFSRLIIGTGNSSIGQLYLYQKAGFRITGIKPDFFVENYSEPVIENGIVCRDMIVLTMDLRMTTQYVF
jgi:N-acetylglutamate synthase-like GNAT family acetyltransferase